MESSRAGLRYAGTCPLYRVFVHLDRVFLPSVQKWQVEGTQSVLAGRHSVFVQMAVRFLYLPGQSSSAYWQ